MIRFLTAAILLFNLTLFLTAASGEEPQDNKKHINGPGRYALVIGSGGSFYTDDKINLITPYNNATDVAWALHNAGFSVTLFPGGVEDQIKFGITRFLRQLSNEQNSIGVIYFSGYWDLATYDRPEFNSAFEKYAHQKGQDQWDGLLNIDLPFICRVLPETNRLNVVIADASFTLPQPKRYPNLTQGMDKETLAENTIFFSAAQPGKTHTDGTRRNSPFTAQLLKALGTSDMSLREIIQSVTDQVHKSTRNKQLPWHSKIHKPGLENEILIPKEVREWANQMNPAASQQHPQSFRDCEGCPEMVMVPPGRFMMGSPETEPGQAQDTPGFRREAPQLTVTIPQFAMGKYEVTQAEFRLFALVSGYQTGQCDAWIRTAYHTARDFTGNQMRFSWQNPGYAQWFDRPVTCINMPDAQAYVEWLSKKTGKKYRLPTEAEWEYAARAGTRSSRYWGDKSNCACRYANVADRSFKKRLPLRAWYQMHACDDRYYFTSPVGSFKPNQFGLYDMIGNAWEWTTTNWDFSGHYNLWDLYEQSEKDSAKNERMPRNIEEWKKQCGNLFILKGGAWNTPPYLTRSAYRIWDHGEQRYFTYGFRVVREK